jgi:uncharacterized protein
MNENIIRFLQKQTCATICCVDEKGNPYCFNCFYAFNIEKRFLYFKSSADSYHSKLIKINPMVVGAILPDKLNTVLVKGVQFEGLVLNEPGLLVKGASKFYHQKYPLALAIAGETWTIQVNKIKMTDGTKGFGKKITWNRNE